MHALATLDERRCRLGLSPASERVATNKVRLMEETRRAHRRAARQADQHRIDLSSDFGEVRGQPVQRQGQEAKGHSNHRQAEAEAEAAAVVITRTDLLLAGCTMEEMIMAVVVVVAVVGDQGCLTGRGGKVSRAVLG